MRNPAVLLVVLAVTSAVAHADPVRVQSGGLGFDTGDPSTLIIAGDNFRITSIFVPATDWPASECSRDCAPGTTLDLSGIFGGPGVDFSLGQGTMAVVDGVDYIGTPRRLVDLSGTFTFLSATVTVPPLSDAAVSLTAPFTFSGRIAGSREGSQLFAIEDLQGEGSARVVLAPRDGAYAFRAFQYTFSTPAPVPDPATLLLCGTGLAALIGRERLKGRARAPRQR